MGYEHIESIDLVLSEISAQERTIPTHGPDEQLKQLYVLRNIMNKNRDNYLELLEFVE